MDFQIQASETIAERYSEYMKEPLPGLGGKFVPFYQNLSAITGAGKTLILADTIEQIRAYSSTQPIVLWLSKGKVIVSQTIKFSGITGGKDNMTQNIKIFERRRN